MKRYRLHHLSRYEYREPVDLGSHILHLTPRDLPRQKVITAGIACFPEPARRRRAVDHFGNIAQWMFLDRPHCVFEVVSTAEIGIAAPRPPAPEATPAWEDVAAAARGDWRAAEFAYPSPMIPLHREAMDYARSSFPAGRPVAAGLLDLIHRVRRDFAFRPGATGINTPVTEVLRRREGVCQDFTHLVIDGLRGLGLPARYVSGYIRTHAPPGEATLQGADHSHAWVECWLGGDEWLGIDPTNDMLAGDEHVILAWGRDFGDVSPLRGIILGGHSHTLDVRVTLTALP